MNSQSAKYCLTLFVILCIAATLFWHPLITSVWASPPQSAFDCLNKVPDNVPIADTWSYPSGFSSKDIPPRQGVVLDSAVNPRVPHNGEDYGNHAVGYEVRAAANGVVACTFEGIDAGNLGHAVFVLSRMPDGKHITTLYGHLSGEKLLNKGANVVRGETIIGKIGDKSENGGWDPHLHVGIRDGYVIGQENGWPLTCWGYLKPTCPFNVSQEFSHWHALSDFVSKYSGNGGTNAPPPAPTGNLSWLKTSYTINIAAPWRYTFGFCNDSRHIKLFLDNNLVLEKDEKTSNSSATVGLWRGDHTVKTEVLDTVKGTSPDLQMVAWPASIECKGQVLGASTAADKPTIPPVPTVAAPSTVIAGVSSSSAPTLFSPSNNSTFPQSTEINLVWNPVANAPKYTVELWGGPYSLMVPCDKQTATSCYIGQMRPGAMSWHVKAINSNGEESAWGETWSFTIQQPTTSHANPVSLPGMPSLSGSGNGTSITLTWTYEAAQPDGYKIYIDDQLHETIANPKATSYTVTLPCGKIYAFYVTAYIASSESSPSNRSRAYTGECSAPPKGNPTWTQPDSISLGNWENVDWFGQVDRTGRLHVVWYGWGNTDSPIFYANEDAPQHFSPTETIKDQGLSFSIAIGIDSEIHILDEGYPGVYYTTREPNGQKKYIKINSEGGAFPGVSVDANGNIYGVWSCGTEGNYAACIGKKPVDASWEFWKIPGVVIYTGNIQHVAVDPAGNIHAIVFGRYKFDNIDEAGLYHITQTVSGEQSVIRLPDACSYGSFAIDASGTLHLAPLLSKFGYCTKPVNSNWSPVQIAPNYDVTSVAVDQQGNIYAVGIQDSSSGKQGAFTWRNVSSGTWMPLTTVAPMPRNPEAPTIFVSSDGKVHIAWLSNEGGEWRLFHTQLQ